VTTGQEAEEEESYVPTTALRHLRGVAIALREGVDPDAICDIADIDHATLQFTLTAIRLLDEQGRLEEVIGPLVESARPFDVK
jgi:hypothetical protein